MAKNEKRPLVTFALFAYNQEKFICEAVEGALAQDYEPLEIIISDDCSSDSTFEKIKDIIANYNGNHKVILNRNDNNLGLAGHINNVMKMVRSDFVVVAAGDDISLPGRTRSLVNVWMLSGRNVLSVHSCANEIDEFGRENGKIRQGCCDQLLNDCNVHASQNIWVLGATQAWDMRIIRDFPPLLSSLSNEDIVLPARAAMLGKVFYVNKQLVKYRVGVGVSHEVLRQKQKRAYGLTLPQLRSGYLAFLQKKSDFRYLKIYNKYKNLIQKSRAMCYYPFWLRTGHLSKHKIYFFVKYCPISYLLYEYIKYKFPILVCIKQFVQFEILKYNK